MAKSGARSAPGGGSAAGTAGTTALPLSAGPAVVRTASITIRASNVRSGAAHATRVAQAAGGYVSGESTESGHSPRARATLRLQLKIPSAAYPATLRTLSTRIGAQVSMSQRARDVTRQVADVTSRVASAQAAVAALRKLLARAGSVSDLLNVQDQINQEEASLEALQSQQRALSHETTYATVSLTIVAAPPPGVAAAPAGGFLGGLSAGWRALRTAVAAVLTAAGAALPFAVPATAALLLGYWWRRQSRRRRRARAGDAG